MKNPKITTGVLLKNSPISNASLSEIATSLTALSRSLVGEYAKSLKQSLKQLTELAGSLTESATLSDAVLKRSDEQLLSSQQQLNETAKSREQSRQALENHSTAMTDLHGDLTRLLPLLEALKQTRDEDFKKRRDFEAKASAWSQDFNSRLLAVERTASTMALQYRLLSSELRRLDDSEG